MFQLFTIFCLCFPLLVSCSVDDARKIGEPAKRDTSTFETGVRGVWKGTLNRLKEGNLYSAGQVELTLNNDKTFNAKLFTEKDGKELTAEAEGNYYPIPPDKIAFETKKSTFYPQFQPGIVTTMLAVPLDYSLTLKYDDTEFSLFQESPPEDEENPEQQDMGLYSACTSLTADDGSRLTFAMTSTLSFTSQVTTTKGKIDLSGFCSVEQRPEGRPAIYNCIVNKASEDRFVNTRLDYSPKYTEDKITGKFIDVSADDPPMQKTYECR